MFFTFGMPKVSSTPDLKSWELSGPDCCFHLQGVSYSSDRAEVDVPQEDTFLSAVDSVSWATGPRSDAVELSKVKLVLRTAFPSLPRLSAPSAPKSIYSLLEAQSQQTPKPLGLLQSPSAPAPPPLGWLPRTPSNTRLHLCAQISILKAFGVTDRPSVGQNRRTTDRFVLDRTL